MGERGEKAPRRIRAIQTAAAKYGVDWFLWRVALAEPTRTPIHEIKQWAFRDVYLAHVALDAWEEMVEYHRAQAEA